MRKRHWIIAAVAAIGVLGCGGSDVTLVQYSAVVVQAGTTTFITGVADAPGSASVYGQTNTGAFFRSNTGVFTLFPDTLSAATDIIAGVNAGNSVVGYDIAPIPGQVGLFGSSTSWSPNNFGITLTAEYLRPSAISDNGQIAILMVTPAPPSTVIRRVVSTNTIMTGFTDFRPTEITGINDAGKMVGNGTVLTDNIAWMTDGNTIVNLGVGTARAVNALGIVVGQNSLNQPYRTVSANSTNRASLALLPGFTIGEAMAINDSGVIVGWQRETVSSPKVPVAWYANGALVDLRTRIGIPPADVALESAVGITESGDIAVQGRETTGALNPVGILLEPATFKM